MTANWSLYRQDELPRSSGRLLLAEALIGFCDDHMGLDGSDIADAMEGGDHDSASYVRSTIDFLGALVLSGDLECVSRPQGGGSPLPMPPSLWEIDNFEGRFRTSAFKLSSWWQTTAEPDHWIFVTQASWTAFMTRWAGEGLPEEQLTQSPVNASGTSASLLKIDQVVQRTGLSRSSIYDKIGKNEFPRAVRVGKRAVRWNEAAVSEWVSNQH